MEKQGAMKKALLAMLALTLACFMLTACASNSFAGKWQDESGVMTLNLNADGTGTLETYVAMFNSTTSNDIRYEQDGDALKVYFEDDTDYSLAPVSGNSITYMGIVFTKQ